MSFNQEIDLWTIPENSAISKGTTLGGRPWKFAVDPNYYVDQPDARGLEWLIGRDITPVITSLTAEWFR